MRVPSFKALLVFLLPALVAWGCSGSTNSTPTAPGGGELLLSGTVGFMGRSTHDLVLPADALLTITVAEINVLLFDITQGQLADLVIGLGLGTRDTEGICQLSSNFLVSKGQVSVFRLASDSYCLTVFDAGSFPEDAVVGYRLDAVITS